MGRNISLFADYHGKENSVTNFCGLMLKMVWQENAQAFSALLDRLFEALHLRKNRDIGEFTKEDHKNTARLIDAILEGKTVSGLKKDIPYVALLDYTGTKLLLVFKPTDIPGTYRIKDFFADKSYELFRVEENGERLPTSKYMNLKADDFLSLGNVDYKDIIESFIFYINEPYCMDEATHLLLQIIHAFDKSKDKRTDILEHAEYMAKWLMEIENVHNVYDDDVPHIIDLNNGYLFSFMNDDNNIKIIQYEGDFKIITSIDGYTLHDACLISDRYIVFKGLTYPKFYTWLFDLEQLKVVKTWETPCNDGFIQVTSQNRFLTGDPDRKRFALQEIKEENGDFILKDIYETNFQGFESFFGNIFLDDKTFITLAEDKYSAVED